MVAKKQLLLVLLFGAFSLHLAHQLFPHHHHTKPVVTASHSHATGNNHHHHHESDSAEDSNPNQNKSLLDELLSLINHGKADSPIQSGSQIKADFCKVITLFPVLNPSIAELSVKDFQLKLPGYAPPEQQSQQHVILFKSRRGPPAMA